MLPNQCSLLWQINGLLFRLLLNSLYIKINHVLACLQLGHTQFLKQSMCTHIGNVQISFPVSSVHCSVLCIFISGLPYSLLLSLSCEQEQNMRRRLGRHCLPINLLKATNLISEIGFNLII